jgi:uncharacterized RDD family membrane protein YckC
LAVLLPAIGVSIRRLHDTNRSGWWLLIGLSPLIGAIVLIVFAFQDSQPGTNQYGPNPKEGQAATRGTRRGGRNPPLPSAGWWAVTKFQGQGAAMEHVGVGLRAVATIIDAILLFVIGYVIALMTGGTTGAGFELQGVPMFIWLAIGIGYYIVLEAQFGATLGKRILGLKVVKLEGGGPIDWQASTVRNLLRLVDGFFFYLVGAIVVWTSAKKQRLGDKVAGTVIVRAQQAAAPEKGVSPVTRL